MALKRFAVKCEKKETSNGVSRKFISWYWINNSSSRHIICLRILGEQIMAKSKKEKNNFETELSKYKHSLELVRTVVPILVLILQVFILGRIV